MDNVYIWIKYWFKIDSIYYDVSFIKYELLIVIDFLICISSNPQGSPVLLFYNYFLIWLFFFIGCRWRASGGKRINRVGAIDTHEWISYNTTLPLVSLLSVSIKNLYFVKISIFPW